MGNEFKKRYVLGEGHPWAYGGYDDKPYFSIGLQERPTISKRIILKWPNELWKHNLPKYRLVLERVD